MLSIRLTPCRTRVRILALALSLASIPCVTAQERGLVRINIIKTSTQKDGSGEMVELNGRTIPNYHPKMIQVFPSTGVVLDDRGNVLTFLGYRWVDVYGGDLRVEIVPSVQTKLRGKL